MDNIALEQDIVKQLVDIYFKEEWWHKSRLTPEQAYEYHKTMLDRGNIQVYEELGMVLGYVQSLRVNFEQWGRIVCHAPFNEIDEDTTSGNIAVVHNVWVDKAFRHTKVLKALKIMFFKANFKCEYFAGETVRKKPSQIISVYRRDKLLSRLFTQGEI